MQPHRIDNPQPNPPMISSHWLDYSRGRQRQLHVHIASDGALKLGTTTRTLWQRIAQTLHASAPNRPRATITVKQFPKEWANAFSYEQQKNILQEQSAVLKRHFEQTAERIKARSKEASAKEEPTAEPKADPTPILQDSPDLPKEQQEANLASKVAPHVQDSPDLPKEQHESDLASKGLPVDQDVPSSKDAQPVTTADETATTTLELQDKPTETRAIVPAKAPSIEQIRYAKTREEVQKTVATLRERSQFLAANWLEGTLTLQNSIPETCIDDALLKSTREYFEDALDSIEEIPFLKQLQVLPDGTPEEQTLKMALICQIRNQLSLFNSTLEEHKNTLGSLMESCRDSSWKERLFNEIDFLSEASRSLSNGFDLPRGWLRRYTFIPSEQLEKKELPLYAAAAEELIESSQAWLEKETGITSLTSFKTVYTWLDKIAAAKAKQLLEQRRFLHLHHLEQVQLRAAKAVAKALSSIDSSQTIHACATAYESAAIALKQELIGIESLPNADEIEQLLTLESEKSPYTTVLHETIVQKTLKKLDAFDDYLKKGKQKLEAAIPILQKQEQQSLAAGCETILKKIADFTLQTTALRTHFSTRLHVWNLFPVLTPLTDLPANSLKAYMASVDTFIEETKKSLGEDTSSLGFLW